MGSCIKECKIPLVAIKFRKSRYSTSQMPDIKLFSFSTHQNIAIDHTIVRIQKVIVPIATNENRLQKKLCITYLTTP
jgi:hypothetical protein